MRSLFVSSSDLFDAVEPFQALPEGDSQVRAFVISSFILIKNVAGM